MKRTPLKAKTPLKRKTTLKSNSTLKTKTPLKAKTVLKAKQKTAKKSKEPYHSIFTDNLDICYITGTPGADPHHIFSGPRKALSEKYGFILPLRRDWHEGTDYSIHKDRQLQLKYIKLCQDYYINVLGKTREDWIAEFDKYWE